MKTLLISLFLCCLVSAKAFDQNKNFILVSDFDDTVKVTNVLDKSQMIENVFFHQDIFKGMNILFLSMDSYAKNLFFISASPRVVSKLIRKTLEANSIDYKELYTRDESEIFHKIKYKKEKLELIYNNNQLESVPSKKLILFGDNAESDPLIYTEFSKAHPEKVEQIYIRRLHQVENISKDIIEFYTPFDIAVNEFKVGRMSESDVLAFSGNILLTENLSEYFPDFAYCPTSKAEFNTVPKSLQKIAIRVRAKIISFCEKRNAQNID